MQVSFGFTHANLDLKPDVSLARIFHGAVVALEFPRDPFSQPEF